jgi:hypothetical protein
LSELGTWYSASICVALPQVAPQLLREPDAVFAFDPRGDRRDPTRNGASNRCSQVLVRARERISREVNLDGAHRETRQQTRWTATKVIDDQAGAQDDRSWRIGMTAGLF